MTRARFAWLAFCASLISPLALPLAAQDETLRIGVHVLGDPRQYQEDWARLGRPWLRLDIAWRELEPASGVLKLSALDEIVTSHADSGQPLLLTVRRTPDWARTGETTGYDGPPDEMETYARFLGKLARRYRGHVAAYEIWEEPNLKRNWDSTLHPLSPASYAKMLALAAKAIREADPDALVISAGLAPTAFHNETVALNDRSYLKGLYLHGLAANSDAIGARPSGLLAPPDARCCPQSLHGDDIQSSLQVSNFYFLDTLEAYSQTLAAYGDEEKSLWLTSVGWGTSADIVGASSFNIFFQETDLEAQAAHIQRALELSAAQGYIGAIFLENWDGCSVAGPASYACHFSLIGPQKEARPAIQALLSSSSGP